METVFFAERYLFLKDTIFVGRWVRVRGRWGGGGGRLPQHFVGPFASTLPDPTPMLKPTSGSDCFIRRQSEKVSMLESDSSSSLFFSSLGLSDTHVYEP